MDNLRPDYTKTYPKSTQLQRDKVYFERKKKKNEEKEIAKNIVESQFPPASETSVQGLGINVEKLAKLNLVNSKSILHEVTEENTTTGIKSPGGAISSFRKGMRKSRSTISKRSNFMSNKFSSIYKYKMKHGKRSERRRIDKLLGQYFED